MGDTEPYSGDVAQDQWVKYDEGIEVQYLSPEKTNYANMLQMVREVAPDYIYLNSMFSVPFTLYPLWMLQRRKLNAQVVLAPRGMLQEGALQYKPVKKKVFLQYACIACDLRKRSFFRQRTNRKLQISDGFLVALKR
jgi:hypothetical protein